MHYYGIFRLVLVKITIYSGNSDTIIYLEVVLGGKVWKVVKAYFK